jgi:hypothetical protein
MLIVCLLVIAVLLASLFTVSEDRRKTRASLVLTKSRNHQLIADVHNLQRMLQFEVNNSQRLVIRNRQLTINNQDLVGYNQRLAGELENLLGQVENANVAHAQRVLGGTMLPDCPEL